MSFPEGRFFKDESYFVDNTRFLKVWFNASGDPDKWLRVLNQLRLVEFRDQHPHVKVTLLVDKSKLSEKAIKEMQVFSNQHAITLIDFDEFAQTLTDTTDQAIYRLARKELDAKGGNVASARDLVTMLPGILAKYGIYSDFDVKLSPVNRPISKLERVDFDEVKTAKMPRLLMPYVREEGAEIKHNCNNDVLVVTRQKGETDEEVELALREDISTIQQRALFHYQQIGCSDDNRILIVAKHFGLMPEVIPNNWRALEGDAIDWREKVLALYHEDDLDEKMKNQLEEFKQFSVQFISQAPYFFNGENFDRTKLITRAIASFKELGKHYHSNILPFDTLLVKAGEIEKKMQCGDSSWIVKGFSSIEVKKEFEALKAKYTDALQVPEGSPLKKP